MSWTITDHDCYINTSIGKIKIKPRPHGRLCDVYIGNLGLFMVEAGRLDTARLMAVAKLKTRAQLIRKRMMAPSYQAKTYDALGQAIKLPLGNLRVRYSNECSYSIHLNQKVIAKNLDNFGLHVVGPSILDKTLENFIQQINE